MNQNILSDEYYQMNTSKSDESSEIPDSKDASISLNKLMSFNDSQNI